MNYLALTAMGRRTEIRIETHRRLIVRQFGGSVKGWCNDCRAEVWLITPSEAAAVVGETSRIIYQWLEHGKLHFSEELEVLLICAESLMHEKETRLCTNSKSA
jgi:hypothetical protein